MEEYNKIIKHMNTSQIGALKKLIKQKKKDVK